MPDPNQLGGPMLGPVPVFFPPFPNEEQMRRGRLNAEAPLGNLGETHSVKKRRRLSASWLDVGVYGFFFYSIHTLTSGRSATRAWGESLPP